MAKTIKEMIEVMEHYDNGGEVEFKQKREDDTKWRLACPDWNWDIYTYRIKEPKQKVTIEKWLCQDRYGDFLIFETSNVDKHMQLKKIKLIESYEVEL